jgi:hypothetical protein
LRPAFPSTPSPIDNDDSESDDEESDSNFLPFELGNDDFEIDEDIDLHSSILIEMLKTGCKVGTTLTMQPENQGTSVVEGEAEHVIDWDSF